MLKLCKKFGFYLYINVQHDYVCSLAKSLWLHCAVGRGNTKTDESKEVRIKDGWNLVEFLKSNGKRLVDSEWTLKKNDYYHSLFYSTHFTRLLFCISTVFDVRNITGIKNRHSLWQHKATPRSVLSHALFIWALLQPNCGAYHHRCTFTN